MADGVQRRPRAGRRWRAADREAPLVGILLARAGRTRLAAGAGDAAATLLDLGTSELAPLLDVFEPGPLARGEPFLPRLDAVAGRPARTAPARRSGRVRATAACAARSSARSPFRRRRRDPADRVRARRRSTRPCCRRSPRSPPTPAACSHGRRSSRRERAAAMPPWPSPSALAERDPVAGVHARVVSGFAGTVAARLGPRRAPLRGGGDRGLLHDIGKLALPDRILDKPGPLEPTERALVQEHPAIGERILPPVPGLAGSPTRCAPRTSGSTAAATRTGSPARRSHRRADRRGLRHLARDDERPRPTAAGCRRTRRSTRLRAAGGHAARSGRRRGAARRARCDTSGLRCAAPRSGGRAALRRCALRWARAANGNSGRDPRPPCARSTPLQPLARRARRRRSRRARCSARRSGTTPPRALALAIGLVVVLVAAVLVVLWVRASSSAGGRFPRPRGAVPTR